MGYSAGSAGRSEKVSFGAVDGDFIGRNATIIDSAYPQSYVLCRSSMLCPIQVLPQALGRGSLLGPVIHAD